MWLYPYFGTHDSMSAPLIKYDLQNDHLEVKKGGQIFEKNKIENWLIMGVYLYLDTHDEICVLLI